MTTEFRLVFRGATEANTLGWINEYRSHPRDATRLLLPADEFLPQMMAQYPGTAPVEPPTGGTFLGDLEFNGARFETHGANPVGWSYARLRIPDPLPAGWDGATAQIRYSEYIDPQRFRFVTLARVPGDFTPEWPARGLGSSGNLRVAFNSAQAGCTTVLPGQAWFFNVRYRYEDGRPTAGPGDAVDFQISCGVPS